MSRERGFLHGAAPRRIGLAATLVSALTLASSPAVAFAADDCPNAAVRAQQNGSSLPECRAYEQVTPPVKGGNDVSGTLKIRADGNGIGFSVAGTFPGALSSLTSIGGSVRTDSGWRTSILNPPTLSRTGGVLDQYWYADLADDMSRSLIFTQYPIDSGDQSGAPAGMYDLYRTDESGAVAWISKPDLLPDTIGTGGAYAGASSDLGLVVISAKGTLKPETSAAPVQRHIYITDGTTTRLVSAAPGGGPMPGGATIDGTPSGGAQTAFGGLGGPPKPWVSQDGQTVIFRSPTSGAGQLYVRTDAWDPVKGKTRQVSRSADGLTECTGAGAKTVGVTSDGSRVLFICANALTGDAPSGGGMYSYDTATGELTFKTGSTGMSDAFTHMDIDHDYFYYNAAGGKVYHDGTISSIGTTIPVSRNTSLALGGSKLAIVATNAALDPTRNANGFQQVYVYDAEAKTIRCASCPSDGSPAGGEASLSRLNSSLLDYNNITSQSAAGHVSEDGRRVFFSSDSALVPGDVNGVTDAYMTLDGKPYLLSSGTHRYASLSGGSSGDGSTAFILTRESFAPQDIDQGVADIYAVRINGGFAAPNGPGPTCVGDACQPARTPPVLMSAGSAAFTGSGNVSEPADVVAGGKVRVTRPKAVKKGTSVSLQVRAPGKGTIRVSGSGLVKAQKAAKKATSYRVAVRLSPRAKQTLRRKHRVSVRATVRFSPAKGKSSTVRVQVTFTGKAAKKKRAKASIRVVREAIVLSSDSRRGL